MIPPRRDDIVDRLRQRFLSASHLGLLGPGDRLPSARDLARELGVDRRVVLAAYRRLEREGVVSLRQRSGVYFAPAAACGSRPPDEHAAWLANVAAAGITHGVPLPVLADELHRHLGTLRLRAACVECNDDQIAGLCATLRDDFGMETAAVVLEPQEDARSLVDGEVPLALRRADLLVTTPFHAADVQCIAARLGKPWLAVALRADVFAELARLLEHGPAYAVVADPRFATKLALIYNSTVGARHFRALVAGRDDLGAIQPGAPTLVTRLARERLDAARLPLPRAPHELAEPTVLAAPSARELAAFIVHANATALAARAAR